ncbi:MAG: C1 family peptidase [Pseudomonadales bacterium]
MFKVVSSLLLLALSAPVIAQPEYSIGATLDSAQYMDVAKIPPLARGDYDDLPNAVSLKKYLPPVGDQGRAGSCVGWSSVYAARTLAEKRRLDLSIPQRQLNEPFSPAYVYNQIKLNPNGCDDGSYISRALKLLKREGVLPLREFPYTDKACHRQPTSSERSRAGAFKIADYRRLSSSQYRSSAHISARKALSRGNPVVIGMLVGETFMRHRGSAAVKFKNRDYRALENSQRDGYGGHAMTVIGYDDKKFGGAFELVNSWGKDWGNRGFAWLSYKDYNLWVLESYELIPPLASKPKPKKKEPPNIRASLSFIDFSSEQLPLQRRDAQAWIQRPMHSGERFRAQIKVAQKSYVYVIGTDRDSAEHVALFPHRQASSAFIGAGETLLLPGPTEQYFSQLNRVEGVDYFVLLTSLKPLNVQPLLQQLNSAREPQIHKRLQRVLGDKLVFNTASQVPGQLTGRLKADQVLGEVISIDHRAAKAPAEDTQAPLIVITQPEMPPSTSSSEIVEVVPAADGLLTLLGRAQDSSALQEVSVSGALETKFSSRGAFKALLDLSQLSPGELQELDISATDSFGNRQQTTLKIRRASHD